MTPPVAIRGVAVGGGGAARGVRALAGALRDAGVHVDLEVRDPGGDAPAGDAWHPAAAGPPVVHLVWDAGAGDAPEPAAGRRIAVPRAPVAGEPAWLGAWDEIWVPDAAAADAVRAAGVPDGRVWVCPEPVPEPPPPARPPGAHGTVFVCPVDPARGDDDAAVARAWARAFRSSDDVTLVLLVDPAAGMDPAGAQGRLVRAVREAGGDPEALADVLLICEPIGDAERLALVRGADVVVDPAVGGIAGRATAEALVCGVPVAGCGAAPEWGWPVATVVSLVRDPAVEPRARGPVRAPEDGDLAARLRECAVVDRAPRAAAAARAGSVHRAVAVAAAVGARLAAAGPAARPAGPGRPRVVLAGSVFGAHSLAAVNRGLARALLARGEVELALRNSEGAVIDVAAPVDPTVRSLAWACARERDMVPDVIVRHGHPADLGPEYGGARVVAVLPWEFGGVPRTWRAALGTTVDEVWVPSDYVRRGWLEAGADPDTVHTVPNGVDPRAFHPGVTPTDLGGDAPGYRFLFVGGLAWRKGVDLLVRAYRAAFGRADDVTLVLKDFGPGGPYPADGADRLVADLAADPGAGRVLRLTGPLPEGALPGLYAACDCLVHPYRAEAYGLTMVEAMACGRAVIAPAAGAARDFMDPSVAMLVPARRVVLDVRSIAGERPTAAPVVHEVAVDDLAGAMRWAYENRSAAAGIGLRAADVVRARHTWDHAARVATARLRAVAGRGLRPHATGLAS